ncbi:MAG: C-type lectin domain-containing protein [Verrucomicrobiales bacterium]
MKTLPLVLVLLGLGLFATALSAQEASDIPELEALLEDYRSGEVQEKLDSHANAVKELNGKYLAALERTLETAQRDGLLEEALALRAERDALLDGPWPPDTKQEDLSPSLAKLRGTYEAALAGLERERDEDLAPLSKKLVRALEKLQVGLTQSGRLEEALVVKAKQEEIAASFDRSRSAVEPAPPTSEPGTTSKSPPEIPKDAVRHRGSRYKLFLLDDPLTWEEARERCREAGGDLVWLNSTRDVEVVLDFIKEVNRVKGHVPIWVGATRDDEGVWHWVNGEEVDAEFWSNETDSGLFPGRDVMVRWIGSFKPSSNEERRIGGYVCRWD